jgi:hypothetical protein
MKANILFGRFRLISILLCQFHEFLLFLFVFLVQSVQNGPKLRAAVGELGPAVRPKHNFIKLLCSSFFFFRNLNHKFLLFCCLPNVWQSCSSSNLAIPANTLRSFSSSKSTSTTFAVSRSFTFRSSFTFSPLGRKAPATRSSSSSKSSSPENEKSNKMK